MKEKIKYKPNPDSHYHKYYNTYRTNWLKRKYGITLEEFNAILLSQNNLCAICSKQLTAKQKQTHLDHDHIKNKVRGILCHKCNMLLGNAKDNITLLYNAIRYLEKHNG
jgi:hypothetical protein